MAKRIKNTGGFSLSNMMPVISATVDSLVSELENQGVSVDPDYILVGLQNLVRGASSMDGNVSMNTLPMLASEVSEVPYSYAGDLVAMAHAEFQSGNKMEAVKQMLEAFDQPEFEAIASGLAIMNSKSKKVLADDAETTDENSDETDDSDNSDDSESPDSSDVDDSGDLSDEEIQKIIGQSKCR